VARCSKLSLYLTFCHQQPACNFSLLHTCHMPCSSHTIWFAHTINDGGGGETPHYAVFPILLLLQHLDPNISNTVSLYSSLYVRGQFSHLYIKTGKTVVLNI
jgi:hypothetical protein